jgi:hypothetical protein
LDRNRRSLEIQRQDRRQGFDCVVVAVVDLVDRVELVVVVVHHSHHSRLVDHTLVSWISLHFV